MRETLLFCGLIFCLCISCSNQSQTKGKKQNLQESLINSSKLLYDTARFDLNPDIRLFTAIAFANISGYDHENTVMSSERLKMRNYLDSILPKDYKEKIAGTFKATDPTIFATVGSKAFNLSLPPGFNWLPDSASLTTPEFRKDEKFAVLLKEFYLNADIPSLWNKYYPKLKKTNYEYAPYFDNAIKDIIVFCRINESCFDSVKFHFNVCPFIQNESGFTCKSKNDIYIIVSPRKTLPGPDAFYHEALHHIINPMVEKNRLLLHKYNQITSVGMESRVIVFNYIDDLLCESMVRTIDYHLQEKFYGWSKEETLEKINNQYRSGLILMPFLYEKLLDYNENSVSLEEYLPVIINQIDIEKEKKRWNSFIKAISINANIKVSASRF